MSISRESRSPEPNHRSSKSSLERRSSNRSGSPGPSHSGRRYSPNTRYKRKRNYSPRNSRPHGSDSNAFGEPKRRPFDYNHSQDKSPTRRGKTTNSSKATSRESRSSKPNHRSSKSFQQSRSPNRSRSPKQSRSGSRCSSSTRNEQNRSHSPRHFRPNKSDLNTVRPQKKSRVDYNYQLDNSPTRREKSTNRSRSTSREFRSFKPNHHGHDDRKSSIVNRRNQRDSDNSCEQGKDEIAKETSDPVSEKRAAVYRRTTTLQNGHTLHNDQTPEESLESDSEVSFSGGKTSIQVKQQQENGYDCTCLPNTLRKASINIEDQLSVKGFVGRKSLGMKFFDVFESNCWNGTEEDKKVCEKFVRVRNSITHGREDEPFVRLSHIHELKKRVTEIIEKKVRQRPSV